MATNGKRHTLISIIVVFEFDTMTGKIRGEFNKMKRMGIKVKYFTSENNIVIDL